MQVTSSLVGYLFQGSSSSAGDSLVQLTQGRTGSGSVAQRDPIATLKDAETNTDKLIAAKAKDPTIKRDLAAFKKAVQSAKSVDALLKDPNVQRVLLPANNLGDYIGSNGLIQKALKSDPNDTTSVAIQLASTNANWLDAAKTYQFSSKGLAIIQRSDTIQAISDAYVEVKWRESLDATAPGVAAALAFKEGASKIKTAYDILGNGAYRQVVTTAVGLPAQIAYQPLTTQATAVEKRIDLKKLQDPAYVDLITRRFLINLNSSSSGSVTA